MPFRTIIEKHLEALQPYEIATIAPSHGPVYDDPAFILDAYRTWVLDPPRNLVVLPYASMHGSTAVMVERLVASLAERGVRVEPFNMTVTDLGRLAINLVDAATIVFGAPTVLTGAHPNVITAAYLTNALRPKLKNAGIIGSYGWGGKAPEQLKGLMGSLKVDWLDPVMCRGLPDERGLGCPGPPGRCDRQEARGAVVSCSILTSVIAGAAGEGVQTIGDVVSRTLLALGYPVFTTQEYESRIRGGTTSYPCAGERRNAKRPAARGPICSSP